VALLRDGCRRRAARNGTAVVRLRELPVAQAFLSELPVAGAFLSELPVAGAFLSELPVAGAFLVAEASSEAAVSANPRRYGTATM